MGRVSEEAKERARQRRREQRQNAGPSITVSEAGRKGGEATRDRYGHEHYEQMGRIGGQKVRELCAKGREVEADRPE